MKPHTAAGADDAPLGNGRRPRLTPEDHLDRWSDAQREFMRRRDGDAKEMMLGRFAAMYRSLNSGSSVGLQEELDRLEGLADRVIEAERAKKGQ